jgi:hypothetical protein
MAYCSATWSVAEAAVAWVSGSTAGAETSPWALSCACIDCSCLRELSVEDAMDSASVERQRSCGSGRGAVRAKARGLDQSALRRIMAVSVVAIVGNSGSMHRGGAGQSRRRRRRVLSRFGSSSVVRLQNVREIAASTRQAFLHVATPRYERAQ